MADEEVVREAAHAVSERVGLYDVENIIRREQAGITVARAWLAEHPADDGEPFTQEWAFRIPGVVRDASCSDSTLFEIGDNHFLVIESDGGAAVQVGSDYAAEDCRYISLPIVKVTTRGGFRRLAATLGIQRKEPA